MKKDLFDHIVILNGRVEFGFCREMTGFEILCSGLFGNIVKYNNISYARPTTFKEFLRCLQKTELSKNLDFRVREEYGKTWYETSYDCLLNHYIECICKKQKKSEKELLCFYKTANKIKTNKINDQQILNNIPKEFIK